MKRRPRRVTPGYLLILAGSLTTAIVAGWTTLASRMDRDAYDWMSRIQPPRAGAPRSVVIAIDEETLASTRGMRQLRRTLARGLHTVNAAGPSVVAIDIILSEPGDPGEDEALAAVFRQTPNLVLGSDLLPGAKAWEDPIPAFRQAAKAVGHVHAAPDPVSRVLPLELAAGRDRRWAMALEAAKLHYSPGTPLMESPRDIQVGDIRIPARRNDMRAMFIRYRTGVPVLSLADLSAAPDGATALRDKVVFVGITAQTAARDRLVTPLDEMMSGVEIHAQAFETISAGNFLAPASLTTVLLLCVTFVTLSGLVFAFLSGWAAYAAAIAVLLIAHATPHLAFSQGLVIPYLATVWAAWLSAVAAASWQHFVVRRQLQKSESDRIRYQQAIQFVTHEMRSPLTAIQGSSELMGRYNLTEEKRKQMAEMINSESKRLAKMIQTFLDVERLTDGQLEIRSEPFGLIEVVNACVERARHLADRKQITLAVDDLKPLTVKGDRELMEYAVYNLLTNAVKYSPAGTVVRVSAQPEGPHARVSVQDQGMGMNEKELRQIGTKFYRTKRAEESGEAGTGIGLSLVQQIVSHHNGRMEITSAPGKGSCFAMVLPAEFVS